jgi:hypothetical protein
MRGHDLYHRWRALARQDSPTVDRCILTEVSWHSGITGGYGGDRRVEYIIPPEARAAGKHDFVIESSCNGMFGVPLGDAMGPPDVCSLVVFHDYVRLTVVLEQPVL